MAEYKVSVDFGDKSFTENVQAKNLKDSLQNSSKFNLFGPATKDDIKIGYISPDSGYIDGISICQANDYAKKNPGTQFVFRTRDKIEYLNINEVNKLTTEDALPKSAKECPGITFEDNCGPPKVYFYGGGGVGAKANPVIGKDGSLLAVDLVSGGFGYQYPPITEVKDNCGVGAGAVVRSVLGEVAETVEYYDQEDDYEEYEICPPTEVGYGRLFSPDGKDIGEWDPTLYANFSNDPIRREIQQYQKFLASLQSGSRVNTSDNSIKKWWTTRTEKPLSVTSLTKTSRVKHDVRHPGWGGEYAQGELFKEETFIILTSGGGVNKGGNNLVFNFTTEDKSHSFKIRAADFKNNQVGQKIRLLVKPNVVYLVSAEGQYKGKGSEIGLIESLGRREKEINTKSTREDIFGKAIFADFLESANDNDDLQAESAIGQFSATRVGGTKGRTTYNVRYIFKDNSVYKPEVIEDSFMNNYAISPVPPSNVPGSDFAGINFTMEWEKEFLYEGDYTFIAMADNIAKVYLDNQPVFTTGGGEPWTTVTEFRKDHPPAIQKRNVTRGVHRIRIDLYNVPIKELLTTIRQIKTEEQKAGSLFFQRTTERGTEERAPSEYYMLAGGNDLVEISFTFKWEGDGTPGKTAATGVTIQTENGALTFSRPIDEKTKKYTFSGSVSKSGVFKNGKKYPITFEGVTDGRLRDPQVVDTCDVNLNPDCRQAGIVFQDTDGDPDYDAAFIATGAKQLSPPRKVESPPSQALISKRIFNTVDYINKADRKLWRTNVYGRGGFINEYGICPFDTTVQLQDNPYAGTHRIVWDNVEFPVDGNYNIDVEVDDNVVLTFQGPSEVVINKKGFSGPGKSTGKSIETKAFRKGKYKIIAELQQIPGGKFGFADIKDINPMALAVNVEASFAQEEVISKKSWNENPLGVALVIDAPLPPIPQESIVQQEGRCPNNPIWTTRFPGASEKWSPVNFRSPKTVTETIAVTTEKKNSNTEDVEFTIYGQGALKDLAFVFTAVTGNHTFTLNGVDKNKKTRKETISILKNTNYVVSAKENSGKFTSVEQGLIKGGTKSKEQGIGESKKIFADYIQTNNDNDDIQITAGAGIFKSSNKRKVSGTKGRNTYDLTYKFETAPGTDPTTTTKTKTYEVPGWSRFMNRYAISPVLPLSEVGTDGSGVVFRTSWKVDIPYNGYYALRGTVDNFGKVIIDGKEILTDTTSVIINSNSGIDVKRITNSTSLDSFGEENPKSTKIFLTKGMHTIEVEVENKRVETFVKVDQKVFDTKDWQSTVVAVIDAEQPVGSLFIKEGDAYYILIGGNDIVEIDFVFDWYDDKQFGYAITKITIPTESKGPIIFSRPSSGTIGSSKATGTFKANKKYGPIIFEGIEPGSRNPEIVDAGSGVKQRQQRIIFWDANANDTIPNAQLTAIDARQLSPARKTETVSEPVTTKNGVTYSGPPLASYINGTLGPFLTPAFKNNDDYRANNMDKTWNLKWDNVDFPVTGQYALKAEADDYVIVKIDGIDVGTARVFEGVRTFNFNVTKGKRTLEMEIYNIPGNNNSTFATNPVVFSVVITVPIDKSSGLSKPWTENPVGISAILIPPPCPKKVKGKGTIVKVIPYEPGNGLPSVPSTSIPDVQTYPVQLIPGSPIIINPGINYNCGVDKIFLNGVELPYTCDSFGRIRSITIPPNIPPITEYPEITVETDTGINLEVIVPPIIVRDPPRADPEQLLQVVDLVGLKQTGYIEGRAYFGSVFYKNDVRYAGVYETAGELIQVYDTLRESIDAQVTTRPSAILRQGTDTSSNNPRLNLPGTPENLI